MSSNVYANGREVSAKKNSNKSMGAMPDVCLSPPSPPAGPIPIPYPNFSKASDTSDGTKKVLIKGKEVGKKNSSNYKSSKGDIAATRSFGMGVVTHTLEKKTYHAAWSFNVKFEGENAIRHMDITTHNHGSTPPNTLDTTVDAGGMKPPSGDPDCVELENTLQNAEQNDTETGSVDSGQVLAVSKHSEQGIMKSASQSLMKKNMKPEASSGYLERPKRPKTKGGKTREPNIACTDALYNGWTCSSGHAEGKAIQKVFSAAPAGGGTLTLRIRWNDAGTPRQMPCGACKSAICKTATDCNIKIEICVRDANGKLDKKSAPCTSDGEWNSRLL